MQYRKILDCSLHDIANTRIGFLQKSPPIVQLFSATLPCSLVQTVASPKGLSGKIPRFCRQGFARGKSRGSTHTAPQHSVGIQGSLLRGQLLHSAPRIFNSCSEVQHTVRSHTIPEHSAVWGLTLPLSKV